MILRISGELQKWKKKEKKSANGDFDENFV